MGGDARSWPSGVEGLRLRGLPGGGHRANSINLGPAAPEETPVPLLPKRNVFSHFSSRHSMERFGPPGPGRWGSPGAPALTRALDQRVPDAANEQKGGAHRGQAPGPARGSTSLWLLSQDSTGRILQKGFTKPGENKERSS